MAHRTRRRIGSKPRQNAEHDDDTTEHPPPTVSTTVGGQANRIIQKCVLVMALGAPESAEQAPKRACRGVCGARRAFSAPQIATADEPEQNVCPPAPALASANPSSQQQGEISRVDDGSGLLPGHGGCPVRHSFPQSSKWVGFDGWAVGPFSCRPLAAKRAAGYLGAQGCFLTKKRIFLFPARSVLRTDLSQPPLQPPPRTHSYTHPLQRPINHGGHQGKALMVDGCRAMCVCPVGPSTMDHEARGICHRR